MKRKGCGPQALGSPIKQIKGPNMAENIYKKQNKAENIYKKQNKTVEPANKQQRHDGSYNAKMFPPIKDYNGRIVTPGYNPNLAEVYKKNAANNK